MFSLLYQKILKSRHYFNNIKYAPYPMVLCLIVLILISLILFLFVLNPAPEAQSFWVSLVEPLYKVWNSFWVRHTWYNISINQENGGVAVASISGPWFVVDYISDIMFDYTVDPNIPDHPKMFDQMLEYVLFTGWHQLPILYVWSLFFVSWSRVMLEIVTVLFAFSDIKVFTDSKYRLELVNQISTFKLHIQWLLYYMNRVYGVPNLSKYNVVEACSDDETLKLLSVSKTDTKLNTFEYDLYMKAAYSVLTTFFSIFLLVTTIFGTLMLTNSCVTLDIGSFAFIDGVFEIADIFQFTQPIPSTLLMLAPSEKALLDAGMWFQYWDEYNNYFFRSKPVLQEWIEWFFAPACIPGLPSDLYDFDEFSPRVESWLNTTVLFDSDVFDARQDIKYSNSVAKALDTAKRTYNEIMDLVEGFFFAFTPDTVYFYKIKESYFDFSNLIDIELNSVTAFHLPTGGASDISVSTNNWHKYFCDTTELKIPDVQAQSDSSVYISTYLTSLSNYVSSIQNSTRPAVELHIVYYINCWYKYPYSPFIMNILSVMNLAIGIMVIWYASFILAWNSIRSIINIQLQLASDTRTKKEGLLWTSVHLGFSKSPLFIITAYIFISFYTIIFISLVFNSPIWETLVYIGYAIAGDASLYCTPWKAPIDFSFTYIPLYDRSFCRIWLTIYSVWYIYYRVRVFLFVFGFTPNNYNTRITIGDHCTSFESSTTYQVVPNKNGKEYEYVKILTDNLWVCREQNYLLTKHLDFTAHLLFSVYNDYRSSEVYDQNEPMLAVDTYNDIKHWFTFVEVETDPDTAPRIVKTVGPISNLKLFSKAFFNIHIIAIQTHEFCAIMYMFFLLKSMVRDLFFGYEDDGSALLYFDTLNDDGSRGTYHFEVFDGWEYIFNYMNEDGSCCDYYFDLQSTWRDALRDVLVKEFGDEGLNAFPKVDFFDPIFSDSYTERYIQHLEPATYITFEGLDGRVLDFFSEKEWLLAMSELEQTSFPTRLFDFFMVREDIWNFEYYKFVMECKLADLDLLSVVRSEIYDWLANHSLSDLNLFFILVAYFITFYCAITLWSNSMVIESTLGGRYTRKLRSTLVVGFFIFLLSEIMLFSGLFGSLWTYMFQVTPDVFSSPSPAGLEPLRWFKMPLLATCILLCSGFTYNFAFHLIRMNRRTWSLGLHLFTIWCAILFLIVQYFEYFEMLFNMSDSTYGSIFYLITGFHGFHVLVGTLFIIYVLELIVHSYTDVNRLLSAGLSVIYWHFVDLVWILVLFFIYGLSRPTFWVLLV